MLNLEIKGGSISYSRDLGWGFTCLKASNQEVARQALVLTPCRIGSFLYVFQQWTPLFDPSSSHGMLIPTWITLKKLPLQFFGVAQEIAASLGKVLGKDSQNCYFKDPRFCIALHTSLGWETELEIEDRVTGKLISILVDYANLPFVAATVMTSVIKFKNALKGMGARSKLSMAPRIILVYPISRGHPRLLYKEAAD